MAVKSPPVPPRRITAVAVMVAAVYVALFVRILLLQTVRAAEFRRHASEAHKSEDELTPIRGRILDCNGRVLARTVEECRVIVYPGKILDYELAANILSRNTGVSRTRILQELKSGKSPNVLVRHMSRDAGARLRSDLLWDRTEMGIRPRPPKILAGVETRSIVRREYPLGWIGAKIVGAVNSSGVGIAGVEMAENNVLSGSPGEIRALFDRNGNAIPTRITSKEPARPGMDIVLTIDSRIQFAAEQALKKQVQAFKAASGECIVLDPKSGAIRALAEFPGFDPNHVTLDDSDRLPCVSLAHVYEPGSTAKLVTGMTALRAGLGNVTARCTGRIQVGNEIVHCPCNVRFREHGQPVTMGRMYKYSCNSESSTLARRMGAEALFRGFKDFGLLNSTILPGYGRTGAGVVPSRKDWSRMWLVNASFGQGVSTTRLNLARAYAAVANGGSLMKPMLISEVRSPGGPASRTYRPEEIGRVGSAADCATVMRYLVDAVEDGTGKNARIDGFTIAGKTGSAQMFTSKGVIPGAYITSFVGIAPVEDPGLTILVTVERPRGSTHGATVAAPVFNEVARTALWCVGKVTNRPGRQAPAVRMAPKVSERSVTGQQT